MCLPIVCECATQQQYNTLIQQHSLACECAAEERKGGREARSVTQCVTQCGSGVRGLSVDSDACECECYCDSSPSHARSRDPRSQQEEERRVRRGREEGEGGRDDGGQE